MMNLGQQVSRGILQTQDSLLFQEDEILRKIGPHILISALYKDGLVVGHRFDKRKNEPRQWINKINGHILLLGWGEPANFNSVCDYVATLKINLSMSLPEVYIKIPVIKRFLRETILSAHENGTSQALDLLLVDTSSHKILLIDFSGNQKTLYGFAILGGYSYMAETPKQITHEEIKGKTEMDLLQMEKERIEKVMRHPVKEAVKTLDAIYKNKKHLSTMNQALDAVRGALFRHDTPSKTEEFEFTVFENGEMKSFYEQRVHKPSE